MSPEPPGTIRWRGKTLRRVASFVLFDSRGRNLTTPEGAAAFEEDEALQHEIQKRADLALQWFRGWIGPENEARTKRWKQGIARKRADLEADYERDCELSLNGSRPSSHAAAIAFAYVDVAQYPDDWPKHYRLPDGSFNSRLERQAADRMLTAIKRLQIAQTKRG